MRPSLGYADTALYSDQPGKQSGDVQAALNRMFCLIGIAYVDYPNPLLILPLVGISAEGADMLRLPLALLLRHTKPREILTSI